MKKSRVILDLTPNVRKEASTIRLTFILNDREESKHWYGPDWNSQTAQNVRFNFSDHMQLDDNIKYLVKKLSEVVGIICTVALP